MPHPRHPLDLLVATLAVVAALAVLVGFFIAGADAIPQYGREVMP